MEAAFARADPVQRHGTTPAPEVESLWLGAAAEDIEYLLGDVLGTLSRLETKRGRLQEGIATASRGRRAHRRAPVDAADGGVDALGAGAAPVAYTRKSAVGALRKRLMTAARDVKKERERLEAVLGELEEALSIARERLPLPLPRAGTA